jgi:hypothetical protein
VLELARDGLYLPDNELTHHVNDGCSSPLSSSTVILSAAPKAAG